MKFGDKKRTSTRESKGRRDSEEWERERWEGGRRREKEGERDGGRKEEKEREIGEGGRERDEGREGRRGEAKGQKAKHQGEEGMYGQGTCTVREAYTGGGDIHGLGAISSYTLRCGNVLFRRLADA